MKLLLTADLHLGRSSTGLPPSVAEVSLELSCREAWRRLVALAIREEVDGVLMAGDLVEDSEAYYESLGPLVDGFRDLGEAGIEVFAVGGNHDARAFERLARDCAGMAGVHFVGRGGRWERVGLGTDRDRRAWIEGWSFPDHQHPSDPAGDYDLEPAGGLPVIGLLHADLGSPGSPYAPTTPGSLRGLPADFWLLGHVHRGNLDERSGEAPILYAGSPQAMDFGETGWHGVWMLEMAGGPPGLSQVQLSTVRFEDSLAVDVTRAADREAVEEALRQAADRRLDALEGWERSHLRCVVHRGRLVGEWDQGGLVEGIRDALPALLSPERDGLIACFDGKLEDCTRVPLDLAQLATRGGAVGSLARAVTGLESADWRPSGWFREIHEEVLREYESCRLEGDEVVRDDGRRPFGPPCEEETRAALARQGRQLLLAAVREGP